MAGMGRDSTAMEVNPFLRCNFRALSNRYQRARPTEYAGPYAAAARHHIRVESVVCACDGGWCISSPSSCPHLLLLINGG